MKFSEQQIMAEKDRFKPKSDAAAQGAFIDEHGREVPITDEMIKEALDDVKPQSIGWKTGMMEAISEEMLEGLKKS